MQTVSNTTFGPLVAYLVPGATALWGFSKFSPALQSWFATVPTDAPTIGGFLYLTVASLAAGMTVNAVRWAVLDTLHSRTGLAVPPLNFAELGRNVEAFSLLIRIHYEHYQFYGNMFIATAAAYVCYRVKLGSILPLGWLDIGVVVLQGIFFATSRDTLWKYYARSTQVLRGSRRRDRSEQAGKPVSAAKQAPAPYAR